MERRKPIYYAQGGFILGVLVTLVIWLCVASRTGTGVPADSGGSLDPDAGVGGEIPGGSGIPDQSRPPQPTDEPGNTPDGDTAPGGDSDADGNRPSASPDEPGNAADGKPGAEGNCPSTLPDEPGSAPEGDTAPDGDSDVDGNRPSAPPDEPGSAPEGDAAPDGDSDEEGNRPSAPPDEPGDAPEGDAAPDGDSDEEGNRPPTLSDEPGSAPTNVPTKAPEEDSPDTSDKDTDPSGEDGIGVPEASADTWDKSAVYTGGDTVSYGGRRYRAKWWTQGEVPDQSDVWEDLGIVDGEPTKPEGVGNVPVDASVPKDTDLTDFKVVGYYPSWKPGKLSTVDFGIVTHVCYAFAIPTLDGGLRDLENPDTARTLIKSAHANGAKVLLSVGGWSYNDTPLENVFMEATSDDAKTARFAENIIAMCREYGFDGVDMDWEHPRVDGISAKQYEALMLILSEKLHAEGKLLTAAVLSGATADGNIYYDAAAHTNAVLNAVDFINIMAYDGGDGERHSQYRFAVDCGSYWKDTRGLPAHKVVLGVPFYARPSWADYGTIVESVPDAYSKDHTAYNGMDVHYNGVDTIKKKTEYAMENLGGIMIWELTQDTGNAKKSLLQAIGECLQ